MEHFWYFDDFLVPHPSLYSSQDTISITHFDQFIFFLIFFNFGHTAQLVDS